MVKVQRKKKKMSYGLKQMDCARDIASLKLVDINRPAHHQTI